MDVFEAIHDRRSIRRYCPDPVDRSLLEGLFGTISMLMLEERPTAQVEELVDFCLEVEFPVAPEDIGLDGVKREDLEKVAEVACVEGQTNHIMPFAVHVPMVVDAMLAAGALGRQRRALLAGEARLPSVAT